MIKNFKKFNIKLNKILIKKNSPFKNEYDFT